MKMQKKTFQILELLSKSLPGYEATTWLSTPLKELDGHTPYEMIKKNRPERVYALAYNHIKNIKLKKNARKHKNSKATYAAKLQAE